MGDILKQKEKLHNYAVELFYKHYPPFAHVTYETDTLLSVWQENLNYLRLMTNSKNFLQIRKFNKLRIKFLRSYFPEYILLSVKPDDTKFSVINLHLCKNFFDTLKNFIMMYGFKSYYIANILSHDEHSIKKRVYNYFLVFDYIKQHKFFSNQTNTGLNFCVNFYDNINLNKRSIPDDIIGFSLCQIYKFKYYNLYIGFNIEKEEIKQSEIEEFASIYLHEQGHSIDMALYCYLKKPRFLTNLFSSYKDNKKHQFYFKIYQEIFNSAYNFSEKLFLSECSQTLQNKKIDLCYFYEQQLNISFENNEKRILFVDYLETLFNSQNNKTSLNLLQSFFKDAAFLPKEKFTDTFFDKQFFYYLYSKEKNFNLFYNNLNTIFIDHYFHKNIEHQKYLLLPEEKFANTRFYNTQNSYTHFLFEELIREIFTTNNPYFYF